ncbi:MAG TPA: hypothetical protein VFQ75_14440 [Candidatus Limnocylindrales bacterium]|nr:hypothetical protein [Candidatus Limnocylindrales bacterium]
MANDERHMALPKLYGQPAYARPSIVPVAPVERPFDPDDLPLEADQTHEERELVAQVEGAHYSGGQVGEPVSVGGGREGSPMLRGRPFRLGSITSRFKGDGGSSAGA